MSSSYVCYLLRAPNTFRTYIGCTNNLKRRLRQHNSEIKGGARYTTCYSKEWFPAVVVVGFLDKGEVLRFEWAAKRRADRRTITSGLQERIARMTDLAAEHERRVVAHTKAGDPVEEE